MYRYIFGDACKKVGLDIRIFQLIDLQVSFVNIYSNR